MARAGNSKDLETSAGRLVRTGREAQGSSSSAARKKRNKKKEKKDKRKRLEAEEENEEVPAQEPGVTGNATDVQERSSRGGVTSSRRSD